MSCCWMQVASQGLKKCERSPHPLYPAFVNCMLLRFPSYHYRCVTASYETLWQQEETFYCDVKTHPSNRSHCYESACVLYRICYLNFHRLSRLLSNPVVTGCISSVHAICDMPSQRFDEENKVWGILCSDRWEMQFPHSTAICSGFCVLISNQRLNWYFMGKGLSHETVCTSQIILRIVRRVQDSI